MNQLQNYLFLLFLCLNFNLCMPIDTLTQAQPLRDGDVIVSRGESFALGFFSPGNSTRRYVGIWYNKVSERTVVWVANRDNPLNGTSGILTRDNQGNLVLYENNQTDVPVWFSGGNMNTTSSMAQLLDSGNLVLIDQKNGNKILWQSFDYPTDTYIPSMKLGIDRKTGLNWTLSSWKSKDDPGTGTVSGAIDPTGSPQFFLYKDSAPIWRAGSWTGVRWSGIPAMTAHNIFNTTFVNTKDEVYITYTLLDSSVFTRMTVNESGSVQRSTWVNHDRKWNEFWSVPNEYCDYYDRCGANSNCDTYDSDSYFCKCLPGFEPKSPRDWFLRDTSGGCVRKASVSTCRSGEGFVRLTNAKLPDTSTARVDMNMGLKECEEQCLKNCSCTAYTSADERGNGCLSWVGNLIDTRVYSTVGQDLYVRVDAAELVKYEKSRGPLAKGGVKAAFVVVAALVSVLSAFFIYFVVKKRREARDRGHNRYFQDAHSGKGNDHEADILDLPFFHVSDIIAATQNFSNYNKLGEGGFGSVYKGVLQDGREIAVKKLSKNSGQGNEEFKNEVALIAKLQHRNLVRMLGYCIHDQDKMLIYEFLPNKSLDTFIFDEAKRALLNWSMRHEIICGIARGILYLHQDSRLKIIHRDLKASNVLLDASMKPKISDFGMARIFGVDQNEAETHRVVGTYGYMAPEYAMQGLFSVKSDVYSFGVLLIEIIYGRRNSSFYDESTTSNLIGYVWQLWEEGRSLEIVDLPLNEQYPKQDVERCIQIGLLCVQESAADRPTMSDVVFMLTNNAILGSPKQPAFVMKRTYNSGDPSTTSGGIVISINEMTLSMLHPR